MSHKTLFGFHVIFVCPKILFFDFFFFQALKNEQNRCWAVFDPGLTPDVHIALKTALSTSEVLGRHYAIIVCGCC